MKHKIKAFRGDNTLYGVEDNGGIVYDAMFSKDVATRIAELESSKNPPIDWEHTKEILQKEGFDLREQHGIDTERTL